MRKLTIYLLLIMLPVAAKAQEYVYTLYPFAPIHYNPAVVGMDYRASMSYLHQEAEIGPGVNYSNNLLTGEYPMVSKTGRRFGGIGITLHERDAGDSDLLKTYSAGLSLAYNLQISKNQFISFGLKGSYFNKQTSLESLTTGSQWIAAEFRFDPDAALGETISNQNVSYIGLDAGMTWYLTSKLNEQKAFFGVSLLNSNRPNDSFFDSQSEIPSSFLINAGAVLYESRRVQIKPQLLYQKEQSINIYNVILSTKIFISNNNPYDIIKNGDLEFVGRYDFNRDASFGIIFNQPNLSLGFSYNFPTSNETQFRYLQGGSEFGITLSKAIWKPKPKVISINDQQDSYQRDFYFDKPKEAEQKPNSEPVVVAQKSETDLIEENIEKYSDVNALQFELEKDFKFPFNEATLNESAKEFLRDFYTLFEENETYQLEIIGHTDNVGKPLANYKLSQERADAVADYLFSLGLSEDRVKTVGKGDTEPIVDNDSEEGRARNRRVEFIIFVNR
ncbi:MAG: PorP/SprF family type IX secretion system membrane protein [Cyclobacteriaceae bacterium]